MSDPKRYSPSIEWDDDTNQKESVMIECVGGSWIKYSDYARLKAEVEAYRSASDEVAAAFLALHAPHNQVGRVCEGIARLKAENERLRKAGDKLAGVIGLPVNDVQTNALVESWNAAKEGKQP